jgi:YesN/AraC family two-component response regulator
MNKKYIETFPYPVNVLIIDDDIVILTLLEKLLTKMNAKTIYKTSNGKEALTIVCENSDLHLIICDIHMDDIDGIDLIKKFISHNITCPIIIFTGTTETELTKKAMTEGATAVLLKPSSPFELSHYFRHIISTL